MPDKHLNIISFAIPSPPNYGGIIDVYYKLVALKNAGIKIHLHCFEYDRNPDLELLTLCETVTYHKRSTGLRSFFSLIPYIVLSRKNKELLSGLLKNDYPILFEGLHSCYYLNDVNLKSRKNIYRESNIEHHYYRQLAHAEKNIYKKLFFYSESIKLKWYEKKLEAADLMLVVSQEDEKYLKCKFGGNTIKYLPSFHGNSILKSKSGKGDYILYHGNLSVPENVKAALYLIDNVFSKISYPVIIAGLNPASSIVKAGKRFENIKIIASPGKDEMQKLIEEAHIHILLTFQATGLKLKLLNTLYSGRFVIVNNEMLAGTGLESLCNIAGTPEEILEKIDQLQTRDFSENEIERRQQILNSSYSDKKNAAKLVELIF